MAWIAQLQGKIVGLDTAPVIYFIEKHTLYIDMVRPFFQAVDKGECSAVTSTITFFLTNDKRIPSLPGLQVLVLDNLKEDS